MKKDFLLKLNIQHFAGGGEDNPGDTTPPGDEPKDKSFTQSEVDSQISKAVHSALQKREAKHQEDLQKAIDDALAEKERLSKLSEKERNEEELNQREKELADRLAEIERKELKADAIADLTEKGLSIEFADFLLADNAENTLANINSFKTAFDLAVNEKVKEKLRQDTPPTSTGVMSKNAPSVATLAQEHRLIK